METFQTSAPKVCRTNERMTLSGKNQKAGVIVRGATVLLKAELHLTFLWLGLRIRVSILLDLLTFHIQNLQCRRTFFTFEFARYQLYSEFAAGKRGLPDRCIYGSFQVLFFASCLFTDIL